MPTSRSLAAIAVIFLAAFLLYGRGLGGYFMADDFGFMSFAAGMSAMDPFTALSWFWRSREELGATEEVAKLYRPLSDLSYPLQYYVAGAHAMSYRLLNLLLHAGSACLCMGIVWRLFKSPQAALAGGLLFALSPAHPESLLWISSRMNLMAGFGILLSLYCFMRLDRTCISRMLTLLGACLAMFSKETGLVVAPLLTVYAFCLPREPALDSAGRLRSSLQATWMVWLLLAGYFVLRYLALGTVLGGYQQGELFSGEYWLGRAQLCLLYLSPVHLGMLSIELKYLLLAFNLGLAWLALGFLLKQTAGRASLFFLLLWMVGSFLLTYAAPFHENGWTQLQDSRLLYEPSMPLAVLLGFACANLVATRALLACCLVILAALFNATIAWQNSEPWLAMGRASEAIHEEMQAWTDESFEERWLVDVPGVERGAYLFLGAEPSMTAPVFPADLFKRVKLLRRSRWQDLLRRVDLAVREGSAQGLSLYRFSLADLSISPEPIPEQFPISLSPAVELRFARLGKSRIRPGEAVPIQCLLGSVPETDLELKAELLMAGQAIGSASHLTQSSMNTWLLKTAEDLPAGRYRLRLSLGGVMGGPVCDLGELEILGS